MIRFSWRPSRTQFALACLFVAVDLVATVLVYVPNNSLGSDGALYSLGARAWLTGGDPWSVSFQGVFLVAPPTTLVPFVATAFLPTALAGFIWAAIGFSAAVAALRILRAPLWWTAFPPLFVAAFHGSIEPILLLLLVAGPRALAPLLKPYAVFPLIGCRQWKAIGQSVVLGFASVALLPWAAYVHRLRALVAVAGVQSHGGLSAWSAPALAILALIALAALGGRVAGYLIVPVLWPLAQLHYSVVAVPVLVELPATAALAAVPFAPYLVAIGAVYEGGRRVIRMVLRSQAARDPTEAPARDAGTRVRDVVPSD